MRSDMARVIVERPRIPAFKVRKGRDLPLEDMPFRKGMRRGHAERGDVKELNENLAPLRRYLEKQVGRRWDKIYAEISARLRVSNAVQQHVRDHLRDFVAVTPRRINGGWRTRQTGLWYQALYVDPRTGLLCRTDRLPEEKAYQRRRRRRLAPPIECIALEEDRELRLIGGIWYEVCFAALPEPEYRACREIQSRRLKPYDPRSQVVEVGIVVRRLVTQAIYDAATGRLVEAGPAIDNEREWAKYRKAWPHRRYAISKRTLSRQELRRHGLTNPAGTVECP
jgi:hypothetical protein